MLGRDVWAPVQACGCSSQRLNPRRCGPLRPWLAVLPGGQSTGCQRQLSSRWGAALAVRLGHPWHPKNIFQRGLVAPASHGDNTSRCRTCGSGDTLYSALTRGYHIGHKLQPAPGPVGTTLGQHTPTGATVNGAKGSQMRQSTPSKQGRSCGLGCPTQGPTGSVVSRHLGCRRCGGGTSSQPTATGVREPVTGGRSTHRGDQGPTPA